MKDRFLLGTTAGAVGGLVIGILHLLFDQIPGVSLKMIYGVSKLFVPAGMLGTLEANIIGGLANIVCASVIGLFIMTAIEMTGFDSYLFKGAMLGTMIWFLTCGLLARVLKLNMQDTFWDTVLIILIHAIYGIVAVWFIKKYRVKIDS